MARRELSALSPNLRIPAVPGWRPDIPDFRTSAQTGRGGRRGGKRSSLARAANGCRRILAMATDRTVPPRIDKLPLEIGDGAGRNAARSVARVPQVPHDSGAVVSRWNLCCGRSTITHSDTGGIGCGRRSIPDREKSVASPAADTRSRCRYRKAGRLPQTARPYLAFPILPFAREQTAHCLRRRPVRQVPCFFPQIGFQRFDQTTRTR